MGLKGRNNLGQLSIIKITEIPLLLKVFLTVLVLESLKSIWSRGWRRRLTYGWLTETVSEYLLAIC